MELWPLKVGVISRNSGGFDKIFNGSGQEFVHKPNVNQWKPNEKQWKAMKLTKIRAGTLAGIWSYGQETCLTSTNIYYNRQLPAFPGSLGFSLAILSSIHAYDLQVAAKRCILSRNHQNPCKSSQMLNPKISQIFFCNTLGALHSGTRNRLPFGLDAYQRHWHSL